MYSTVIYRPTSSATTQTNNYNNRYESSTSTQQPKTTSLSTNNKSNEVVMSNARAIRHELNHIKNDIKELKRQQTSPIYLLIKSTSPNNVSSMYTSISSNNPCRLSSQNSMYYCNECNRYINERTSPQYSIFKPKTATTTYQDSYNREWSSSAAANYVCYPIHENRSTILKELQKKYPSLSPAVEIRPNWISPSSKSSYPYRRCNLGAYYPDP
ncbi:unnamed protein product [Rotaria sordida]|uniref:Uncharacterized protein n=1 Tax=Rotaria sordida TaxID=392033 RepID=A0A814C1J1_9BILA|nr:unnamed protein product [Rotaria sordida]CAF0934809.1 unnamed protein product [Rotaria sordida]CAF3691074.1 unnamed protein product [Rotaria sordida]CAF3922648.1 unnamed protein product [Rotaria sordida]